MNDDFSPRLTAMRDALVAEVDRTGAPGTAPPVADARRVPPCSPSSPRSWSAVG